MRLKNIGDSRTINEYVRKKLAEFESSGKNFETLFRLMFRESGNVLCERYSGFKVVKTTYGEARDDIFLLANAIKLNMPEMTQKEGAVCGIYMENSLLFIETLWALILCGVKPLLMNLLLDKKSLKKAAAFAGCTDVICDGSKAAALAKDLGGFNVVSAEKLDGEKEALREKQGADGEGSVQYSYAGEIIFMTSGTTENVKLCYYTADRFFNQIGYSQRIIRKNRLLKKHFGGELKQLAFLPFYHIFGFVAVYLWFSFFSRTFVFLNDLSTETLTNTVRRRHVTHIFAVPLFWNKVYDGAMKKISAMGPETAGKLQKGLDIAEKIYRIPLVGNPLGKAFSKAAFKKVRRKLFGGSISFMISGGGLIRKDVLRFFNLIGYRLVNGFGMTEVSITSVELSNSVKQVLKGSVGMPLDKVSYRIEDGVLYVKGLVMADYVLENGVRKDLAGWFETKDIAEKRGKSYFILGRADDIIVPESGENINPDILEPELSVPGVTGLCVLGYERGAAIVAEVPSNTTCDEISDIRAALSSKALNTPLRGSVSKIVITTDRLIADGDFKVSRKKLLYKLQNGLIKDASEEVKPKEPEITDYSDDGLLSEIINTVANAKGIDPSSIKPDADLFGDIGLSSLDFLEIISETYRKYGVAMPVSPETKVVTPLYIRDVLKELLDKEGGVVK